MKKRIALIICVLIVLASAFSISAFGAAPDEGTLAFTSERMVISGNNVDVLNYSNARAVNTSEVIRAFNLAQTAKSEEALDKNGEMVGTFNYTLIEDDNLYFYEEVPGGQTPQLMVFDNQFLNDAEFAYRQENTISNDSKSAIDVMSSSIPITDGEKLDEGIAARLEITDSSNNYLTGTIQTPTKSQISQIDNTNAYNYIYSGFRGPGIETDLGLQWSLKEPSIGGWNHWFSLYDGSTHFGTFNPQYDQVTGNNFFLTSTSSNTYNINFTAYKNYGGKVRSTLSGYARYNSSSGGTPGNYWLTSVIEYTKSVGAINYWKVVNTISPAKNISIPSGASSWSKFSNIKLDGNSPNISRMHIKTYYADASYTLSPDNNYLDTLEFHVYKQ